MNSILYVEKKPEGEYMTVYSKPHHTDIRVYSSFEKLLEEAEKYYSEKEIFLSAKNMPEKEYLRLTSILNKQAR